MNEVLRPLVEEVLKDAYLMTLATNDAGGPWAASVIFIHEGENLYWLSSRTTRHSKAIEADSHVAIAITAEWRKGTERGLQMVGHADQLDGHSLDRERILRQKTGEPLPVHAGDTYDSKHSWYRFVPEHIELLHHSFGWNRQRVL